MRFILLVAAMLPLAVSAQIDIEDYRQSVVDYSFTLKKSEAAIDYATESYRVKQVASLPTLTLSGDFTQSLRRHEGQESWNFNLQPQLSQTIYQGGGIKAETNRAKLGVEISQMDAAYDLLEVRYTADYNYYNLSAMRSYRHAVDEYVEIVSQLKEVVALRYQEGYISKSDLLMIETRLSEAIYQKIALEEDYTIALQKFNILRGYPADMPVEQPTINAGGVVPPARLTLEELLARRPDYIAAELLVEQYRASVSVSRSAYNPTLSVGISGIWQPDVPNINGSTVMNGSIFLRLSAPLFHFGERHKAVAAAVATLRQSELSQSSYIDDIRLEESNMWATIIDSRAQVDAAQQALSIGSENLSISTFAYSEGLTTILDVMQAQISWLQLYTNSIWSQFNYLVAISAYKRISGAD